jgi:hypothetical protein
MGNDKLNCYIVGEGFFSPESPTSELSPKHQRPHRRHFFPTFDGRGDGFAKGPFDCKSVSILKNFDFVF